MPVEWTDDLATGAGEIDEQHKELFRRINGLLEACTEGKGKDEVKRVMQFLDDYVATHFSAEEKYMATYGYSGYSGHKAQHLEFMEKFSNLKARLEKEGPGVHLVVNANIMLVEWLQNHIRKLDKALGAFLKTKM
jgi:hemerythrin